MDAEDRPSAHPVIRRLRERPREFAFFQAVRLLELASPGAVALGREGPARQESVRLRTSSSLAFQAAEVTKFDAFDGSIERMTTTILGLYGANSPLPGFYSTDILEYETQHSGDDDPVRLFLDLINHRLLSLLYRAWSKYRWAFTYQIAARDDISRAVFALCGIADPALAEGLEIPAQRLLRYAGFATQAPNSARSLARVISDYFDEIPTNITQCVACWVPINPIDQTRLGSHNSELGTNFVLGESILDRSGKFRIKIGPLDELPTYQRFTPGSAHHRELGGLVKFLVNDPLEFDIQVGLTQEAVPMARLSSGTDATQLGATSWLCSEPATSDKWVLFAPPDLGLAA